jgi:hypothetical protein
MKNSKRPAFKRVNINLDDKTLRLLKTLAHQHGYISVSGMIRLLARDKAKRRSAPVVVAPPSEGIDASLHFAD